MPTDAEPGWAFPAVAPPVDGGDGYSEVVGEFLDGEERLERIHLVILLPDPVIPMTFRVQ